MRILHEAMRVYSETKNVTWKLLCNTLLLFVYVIQIKTVLMKVYPIYYILDGLQMFTFAVG